MFRKIRKRIYLAVEGESEQSFIKFLQKISDQNNIHAHPKSRIIQSIKFQQREWKRCALAHAQLIHWYRKVIQFFKIRNVHGISCTSGASYWREMNVFRLKKCAGILNGISSISE